ncbi:MAG: MAB_1171c family putative transporter, partial [Segniliparus sp.]|uniref:MAB_1171c family putative transporter n=1 Tax=Segniliparus sp. TaxID=2804064 RepID=UPI003F405860
MFFVPGHPGYWQYVNTLSGVAAVCAAGASALFLFELRRKPRDLGRRAITAAFLLETAAAILNNPALARLASERLGTPNIVQLFAAATGGVGYSTALVIALSAWQDPPEKRRKTTRLWLAAAAVVLALMFAMWLTPLLPRSLVPFFAHPEANRPLTQSTSVNDLFLLWAVLKIRSLSGRNTKDGQHGWTARGLRLIRRTTNFQLCAFVVYMAVVAVNDVLGLGLTHPDWLGVPLGVVAFGLIMTGLCLPAAGPLWEEARRRRANERAYSELEPFWRDLADDNPDSTLDQHAD